MSGYNSLQNLSRDPEIAKALGETVVIWANAEVSLLGTMARIMGIGLNMSQAGYYKIPTFDARTKYILSLIPEWKTKMFSKVAITTAIVKLTKLSSTRNRLIHGDLVRRSR